jgi:hypothetical protein
MNACAIVFTTNNKINSRNEFFRVLKKIKNAEVEVITANELANKSILKKLGEGSR